MLNIDQALFVWQLNLTAGEQVEIEDEVDGWFFVSLMPLFCSCTSIMR